MWRGGVALSSSTQTLHYIMAYKQTEKEKERKGREREMLCFFITPAQSILSSKLLVEFTSSSAKMKRECDENEMRLVGRLEIEKKLKEPPQWNCYVLCMSFPSVYILWVRKITEKKRGLTLTILG